MKEADPLGAIEKCNKLQKLGEEQNDDALIGFAHFTKGEIHYQQNEPVDFYTEMISCMKPFERIGEWGYLAMANNMLGIMSLNRGNAPAAMDYYFTAVKYCKEYSLPDLLWIIEMNIGSLYLSISEYKEALSYFKNAYLFLADNSISENFKEDRVYAIVSIASTYLSAHLFNEAKSYFEKIDISERKNYSLLTRLVIDCFAARLYKELNDINGLLSAILSVHEEISSGITVMDVFDDIYYYLEMLLNSEFYNEFRFVTEVLLDIISKTGLKNLEKRCLSLGLRYYRKIDDNEKYHEFAARYFELDEKLAIENRLMVSNMIRLRGSLHDLAEINKEVEKENQFLQQKSESDQLTEMDNRFGLERVSKSTYAEALKNNTSLAVEILDIDYFKQYNDNYGHQAGDKAIRFVADNIKKIMEHEGVYAARYGGDEFVVLYDGIDEDTVFSYVLELKKNIISEHFAHEYSKLPERILTISQGVYFGNPEDSMKFGDFLHAADKLLYRAKLTKRNCIAMSNSMDEDGEVREG